MDAVTFNQFSVVDIRIGTVTKADVPEWSHWVIRMEVDLGSEIGKKKAFSGIMRFLNRRTLRESSFLLLLILSLKRSVPSMNFRK